MQVQKQNKVVINNLDEVSLSSLPTNDIIIAFCN